MRHQFRLGRRRVREAVAQNLGDAPMQRLPAALEQTVVGRVLNQRVLEAVVRLWRRAFDEQKVRAEEAVQSGLERSVIECGVAGLTKARSAGVAARDLESNFTQNCIRKASTQHGADLRNFARRSKPVQARRQRLPQGRRDRLHAPLLPALK